VLQQPVFDAVACVAFRQHGLLDRRKLRGRYCAAWSLCQSARVPDETCEKVRPVAGGSAGDDSVEILGVALRFHQRFTSTIGASVEITARRRAAVKFPKNRLRLQVGFMNSSIPKIDQLFRMADCP